MNSRIQRKEKRIEAQQKTIRRKFDQTSKGSKEHQTTSGYSIGTNKISECTYKKLSTRDIKFNEINRYKERRNG